MKLVIIVFLEFIKIGLFAIGGGFATLPFLYHLSYEYHWFSPHDLTQMLAIASAMPGPIGINLASQAGFRVNHIWGAFVAVAGIMVPSLVFVFIISKILKEFEGSVYVLSIMYMLKAACCGMLSAICFKLLKGVIIPNHFSGITSIDWVALVIFCALLGVSFKQKHDPLFYIGVSALCGLLIFFVR